MALPFLQWAGGKRIIMDDIMQRVPKKWNHYYEPFLGGGAVFFNLEEYGPIRATLSDANEELINAYCMLQTRPADVIDRLREHSAAHSFTHFYRTRAQHAHFNPAVRAARFIYLNKTSSFGMHIVNKQGKFKGFMGKVNIPFIVDVANLKDVHDALVDTTIEAQQFDAIEPGEGDLVYCDPPYDNAFTTYTAQRFSSEDQTRLRDYCNHWRAAGAHVIVSNNDTPLIRELWSDWKQHKVIARRNIAGNNVNKERAAELLMVGNEST